MLKNPSWLILDEEVMDWSDEMLQRARDLWKSHGYTSIAKQLSEEFQKSITKGMIAGVARRQGWPQRKEQGTEMTDAMIERARTLWPTCSYASIAKQLSHEFGVRINKDIIAGIATREGWPRKGTEPKELAQAKRMKNIDLTDTEPSKPNTCNWLIKVDMNKKFWEHATYCNAPTRPGKHFCDHHEEMRKKEQEKHEQKFNRAS